MANPSDARPPRGKGEGRGGRDPLEGLTAPGGSVVGIEGSMYARDVSRPRASDLAAGAAAPVRRASARPDR